MPRITKMKPIPQTMVEKKNPAMMQTTPTPIRVPRVLELAIIPPVGPLINLLGLKAGGRLRGGGRPQHPSLRPGDGPRQRGRAIESQVTAVRPRLFGLR